MMTCLPEMSAEQRATLITLVQQAWIQSLPVGQCPGGGLDSPAFADWFNTQIDAALAEGG